MTNISKARFARERIRRLVTLSGSALTALSAATALANPQDPNVVQGQATFNQLGNLTQITASNGAIINYSAFNIAAGQTVQFIQPSAASRVLNRVTGPDPSQINGTLIANGNVYIVNPAGVYFNQGSVVNVGGLYAAAGNISDADFRRNIDRFTDLTGSTISQGTINAARAVLAGAAVENTGTINSPGGLVVLAAGNDLLVGEAGGHLYARVSHGSSTNATGALSNRQAGVYNSGTVNARGGRAVAVTGDIYGMAIRNSGSITARNVELRGGDRTNTVVTGRLDASGSANNQSTGGSVKVLGQNVALASGARLDASGPNAGGTVEVGGNFQGRGSDLNAQTAYVDQNAAINADATDRGSGGLVVVWSDGLTGFYGSASARGGQASGHGGLIETSGKIALDVAHARVDASAKSGNAGTWLLDPTDITIVAGTGTTNGTFDAVAGTFTLDPSATASIGATTLSDALSTGGTGSGTNVTLSTANAGQAGNGDITLDAAANLTPVMTVTRTLTLLAARDIIIDGQINATGTAGLNLVFQANSTADDPDPATGSVTLNNAVFTNGGNFSASGVSFINTATGSLNTLPTTGTGGSVLITTDDIALDAASSIITGSNSIAGGSVTIRPFTAGTNVFLGTAGAGFSLTTAELSRVSTFSGQLILGGDFDPAGAQANSTDTGAIANVTANDVTVNGLNIPSNIAGQVRILGSGLIGFTGAESGNSSGDLIVRTATGGAIDVSARVFATGTLLLQADTTLNLGAIAQSTNIVRLRSGVSGIGDLATSAGAGLRGNDITLQAGLGDSVATTARIRTDNIAASGIRNSAGTAAPTSFSFLSDAFVSTAGAGSLLPIATMFQGGGPTGTIYTIRSFADDVTIATGSAVAGSALSIFAGDAVDGLTISDALTLASLEVTSGTPTFLSANITTSGVGGQTFAGPVRIGADITLQDDSSGVITFNGAVNSTAANTFALTVNTAGITTFASTVGATDRLSSLTTDASPFTPAGTTIFTGNVSTTGTQLYRDSIILNSDVTFDADTSGSISFAAASSALNSATGTNRAATINSANAVTFSSAVGNLDALSTLTITSTAGPTNLGGNISTVLGQTYNNAVLLTADSVLESSGAGDILFASTVNSAAASNFALTVNTVGTTTFTAAIGTTDALSSLTTDASPFVAGGSLSLGQGATTTGAQTFNDTVVNLAGDFLTTNANFTLSSASVAVLGANTTVRTGTGDITFGNTVEGLFDLALNSTGTTTFASTVGANGNFLASLLIDNLDTPGGTTRLGGDVLTTGVQTFNDAVILTANVSATSTNIGNITFASTIDSDATARTLAINTGGNTVFAGAVGTTAALSSLTTDDQVQAGETTRIGADITTTGAQSFGDAVILTANATLASADGDPATADGNITFSRTVDSAAGQNFSLVVNTSGITTFASTIGATDALDSLTTDATSPAVAGELTRLGGDVFTVGNQTFNDAVVLTANSVLASTTTGDITFASTLDSDDTARTLAVNTAGVTTFAGVVGGTAALSSLTTDLTPFTAAGSTRIGANITTVGNQLYNDALILTANAILASTDGTPGTADGNITFASTIDSDAPGTNRALTVNTSGVTTFSAAVGSTARLASITTDITSPAVVGELTLINANISTTGAQTFNDAAILGANIVLSSTDGDAATTDGNITFGSILNSDTGNNRDLTVNTSGITRFTGVLGGTQALRSLTTDAGGSTRFDANATFSGNTLDTPVAGYSRIVSLTANDQVVIGGNLIINGGPGALRFREGLVTDGTARSLTLNTTAASLGNAAFSALSSANQLVYVQQYLIPVAIGGSVGTTAQRFSSFTVNVAGRGSATNADDIPLLSTIVFSNGFSTGAVGSDFNLTSASVGNFNGANFSVFTSAAGGINFGQNEKILALGNISLLASGSGRIIIGDISAAGTTPGSSGTITVGEAGNANVNPIQIRERVASVTLSFIGNMLTATADRGVDFVGTSINFAFRPFRFNGGNPNSPFTAGREPTFSTFQGSTSIAGGNSGFNTLTFNSPPIFPDAFADPNAAGNLIPFDLRGSGTSLVIFNFLPENTVLDGNGLRNSSIEPTVIRTRRESYNRPPAVATAINDEELITELRKRARERRATGSR